MGVFSLLCHGTTSAGMDGYCSSMSGLGLQNNIKLTFQLILCFLSLFLAKKKNRQIYDWITNGF